MGAFVGESVMGEEIGLGGWVELGKLLELESGRVRGIKSGASSVAVILEGSEKLAASFAGKEHSSKITWQDR
jgi:hypothetical protein